MRIYTLEGAFKINPNFLRIYSVNSHCADFADGPCLSVTSRRHWDYRRCQQSEDAIKHIGPGKAVALSSVVLGEQALRCELLIYSKFSSNFFFEETLLKTVLSGLRPGEST